MLDIETLPFEEMEALGALYSVVDPEIGVNIVDLGLVRSLKVAGTHVDIVMTLTTPACPLSEELEEDIALTLSNANIASSVSVTWEMVPPWDISHVTADGRAQLHALGF